MLFRKLCLLLLGFLLSVKSYADDRILKIEKGFGQASVNDLAYFIDSTNHLSFNYFLVIPENRLKFSNQNLLNFDRHSFTYWLTFKVKNTGKEDLKDLILKLEDPFIDQANCYIFDEKNTQIYEGESGRLVPVEQKSIKSRFCEFRLDLPKNTNKTIVFKVTKAPSNYRLRFAARKYNFSHRQSI